MTEYLVVGGGVIGLSIAYELAGRGVQVRLLERAVPGQEASWAGAGILPPAIRSTAVDPLDQLRGLSHELHPRWAHRLATETGVDTGFRRCGGIYLACSPGEAAALAGLASINADLGIEMHRLNVGQLESMEPSLAHLVSAGRSHTAYLLPDEAQIRNPHHLRALLAACRQRGVKIIEQCEVIELCAANGRLQSLETSAGPVTADSFCFAGGAWTSMLLRRAGIDLGILPIRGQMLLYRCPQPPLSRIVNEGQRYLVPRDDGRVLVGSTEEEAGFDRSTTLEGLNGLREFAERLLPSLRQTPPERSWAGLRPATYDGLPYLGRLPGIENAFVAAGHFRNGLHLSTGTAVVMSELILGEVPQIDLTPFGAQRGAVSPH